MFGLQWQERKKSNKSTPRVPSYDPPFGFYVTLINSLSSLYDHKLRFVCRMVLFLVFFVQVFHILDVPRVEFIDGFLTWFQNLFHGNG